MSAMPIVAATDGSEESLRAVDWAVGEALLRGAPLRIVSAAALLPRMIGSHAMSGYDTVADTVREHRDQALAAATARTANAARGLLIDADRLDGSPAHAVTEAGAGALMLVVGSRGVGAFAAMLLGSVSRYAATHAACPVVVVREDTGAVHRQVGVGVGDLEHCDVLLDYAFEEAAARKASVVALHAWHVPQTDLSRAGTAPGEAVADVFQIEARGAAERMAREVPRRPSQPGRGARPPRPGTGRPVRPRRPGRAGPPPGSPRSRHGHPLGPEPRARPGRHGSLGSASLGLRSRPSGKSPGAELGCDVKVRFR
jgi:nucleotide-binding universal stress UspA family protein